MLPVTLNQKRNNDELALYFRRLANPKQMDWQYVLNMYKLCHQAHSIQIDPRIKFPPSYLYADIICGRCFNC
jgi:hypothetical protein